MMKKTQYGIPLIKTESEVFSLERNYIGRKDGGSRDEKWLQELMYNEPRLLPVDEIESEFLDLYPVCRELPITKTGFLDILFVNKSGLLTLVECKLWKNPEARREVVGQILDYAQELSRWDFEGLDKAVRKCEGKEFGLIEKVKRYCGEEEWDEVSFIDSVTQNLRRGRFLLLIIGDGIKEGVESISNFLQNYAALNFSFALVEEALFELPKKLGGGILVQPRVLCKTLEVKRAVIKIEGDTINVVSSKPEDSSPGPSARPSSLSDQIFFEKLTESTSTETVEELKDLFDHIDENELSIERKSMRIIRSKELFSKNEAGNPKEFNFVRIRKEGTIDFKGWPAPIGVRYKEKLAEMVNHWKLNNDIPLDFNYNIVNSSDRRIKLEEFLEIKEEWLALVHSTLDEFKKNALKETSAAD
jgi:hypothetical protein